MYTSLFHLRNRAINIRLVAPTLGRDFIPDPSVRYSLVSVFLQLHPRIETSARMGKDAKVEPEDEEDEPQETMGEELKLIISNIAETYDVRAASRASQTTHCYCPRPGPLAVGLTCV